MQIKFVRTLIKKTITFSRKRNIDIQLINMRKAIISEENCITFLNRQFDRHLAFNYHVDYI